MKLALTFFLFSGICVAQSDKAIETVHNNDISVLEQHKHDGDRELHTADSSEYVLKNHSDKLYSAVFTAYQNEGDSSIVLPYLLGPYETTDTGQDNQNFGGPKHKLFVCPAPYFAADRTSPNHYITSASEEKDVYCQMSSTLDDTHLATLSETKAVKLSSAPWGAASLYVITNKLDAGTNIGFVAWNDGDEKKSVRIFHLNPHQVYMTPIASQKDGKHSSLYLCAENQAPYSTVTDRIATVQDFLTPAGTPPSIKCGDSAALSQSDSTTPVSEVASIPANPTPDAASTPGAGFEGKVDLSKLTAPVPTFKRDSVKIGIDPYKTGHVFTMTNTTSVPVRVAFVAYKDGEQKISSGFLVDPGKKLVTGSMPESSGTNYRWWVCDATLYPVDKEATSQNKRPTSRTNNSNVTCAKEDR